MRIAVIGAGSMGSTFGGKLRRIGLDVTLMDRRRELIDTICKSGVKVRDPNGEFSSVMPAVDELGALSGIALALVLVDSNATTQVASGLAAVLSSKGCVLTLQNGIGNVETLAAGLGSGRVLGGSTYVSAVTLAPGHAYNSNIGDTVIGELDGRMSERSGEISQLLTEAGFPTRASRNVMGHIWSKFALNCAINPLCAITGLRPGEVARHAEMRALMEDVIGEILSVVSAKGIDLPETDPRRHIVEHAWLRYNKPSMLQHVEQGQRTEIASLNAALVAEAKHLGVAVPCNRAIAALVRGIDARNARTLPLDPAGLERLAQIDVHHALMPLGAISNGEVP